MPDDITLHTSCQKQVTCISNSFIDHFMPEANGEYVKIYLYLLRCLSQEGMEWTLKLDPARKGKRLDLELGIGV